MTDDELQHLIEDATFDYTMGDNEAALAKLGRATAAAPNSFPAWHALAEVNFNLRNFDAALAAAEQGHRLEPGDLFINTTAAAAAASAYLAAAGVSGTATITTGGTALEVDAHTTYSPRFLGAIGIGPIPIDGHAETRLVQVIQGAER